MVYRPLRVLAATAAIAGLTAGGAIRANAGTITSPSTQNLFGTLLNKSDAEITAKLGINQWGQIDWGGSVWNEAYEKYFGLDQPGSVVRSFNSNEAYVWDDGNNDIRSEGMGYGMMIAVQAGDHELFDRLYRFAKNHMLNTSGNDQYYFNWALYQNGSVKGWGPAPDGDEWIAAALLLAGRRWNSDTSAFNYQGDAQRYMHNMLYPASGNDHSLFDATSTDAAYHLVGFYAGARDLSDQSYVLPGFYALFADQSWGDNAAWSDIYSRSEGFLAKMPSGESHGLQPNVCDFNANPAAPSWQSSSDQQNDKYFGFDAHRTPANMAVDVGWTGHYGDYWRVGSGRQDLFYYSTNYQGLVFDMGGNMIQYGTTAGSEAMLACASGTYWWQDGERASFVQHLWDRSDVQGYYAKSLYVIGLLICSGRFRNSW